MSYPSSLWGSREQKCYHLKTYYTVCRTIAVECLQVLQYFIPVDEPRDVASKFVLSQVPIPKKQTNIHHQENICDQKTTQKEIPLVCTIKEKGR
jgi:hypothetical protein